MKAVIFDFDGLIVDTESVWFDVFKDALQEYGVDLTMEEFALAIGTTDDVLFDHLDKTYAVQLDRNAIREKTEALYQQRMEVLILREGVLDYLQSAKQLGLKIGLASSSSRSWVEGFLKKFDIFNYFEVIRTKDDVNRVKPDPELYLQAVEALEVAPEETVVFEDSANGLEAAKAAGLHCVMVPNPVTAILSFEGHRLKLASMGDMELNRVLDQISAKA
ncbi:HAD family hydrolase [Thalassobacillus hwangdonensis]|uniref:HAD family hydrolase n=1 Tax=Thalassobacillus hwangdonensis TaxID=546108 RepID=A0ABW3L1P6_9BACI